MEKFWPVDELGKEVKCGEDVHLDLSRSSVIGVCIKVEPAHTMPGPGNTTITVEGKATFTTVFERTFTKDQPVVHGLLMLKKRDEDRIVQPKGSILS